MTSLEQLAAKLDEVEQVQARQVAELRAENARLQEEVAALRAARPAVTLPPTGHPHQAKTGGSEGRTSRRSLLRTALGAGAATVAVGTLLEAGTGSALAETESTPEVAPNVVVTGPAPTSGIGIDATAQSPSSPLVPVFTIGLKAYGSKTGVYGFGGVIGNSGAVAGTGVYGEGTPGVQGVLNSAEANTGGGPPFAVIGDGSATSFGGGVQGLGNVGTYGGPGVQGEGVPGVRGYANTASSPGSSVGGEGVSGSGVGVSGTSTSGKGVSGASVSATGVYGLSTNGLGGQFQGGRAPVRLVPSSTAGHPAGGYHQKGELSVDVNGALWYCTADGYPGTWKQLA